MNLKETLRTKQLTIGSWIQIGHPVIAEILSNYYDWLAVDLEHTDISLAQTTNLFRAMGNAVPLVRVRENDTLAIRQVLDMGAQGVIVPLVNTREKAIQALQAAKYAPDGVRGHCFYRMNNYGSGFEEYLEEAKDIVVVVMVESREAIENIDSIAGSGVDALLIGLYDLSGSYGIPGNTTHPLILEARRKVLTACDKAGISAGIHIVTPDEQQIKRVINEGFTFLAVAGDTMFLHKIASQFRSAVWRYG